MSELIQEPTQIRASSLNSWVECERRTAADVFYIDVLAAGYELNEVGKGVGAVIGTSTHKSAAYMLRHKLEPDTDPENNLGSHEEATEIAISTFHKEAENGIEWDTTTTNKQKAKDQLVDLVRGYRNHVAPAINPIYVEERFFVQITDGFIGTGAMDAVEEHSINDLKTGASPKGHALQYGFYYMLMDAKLRSENKKNNIIQLREDHLSRKQFAYNQYFYNPMVAAEEAQAVIWRIISAISAFRADPDKRATAFIPNPQSNLCSPKYCRAYGTAFCPIHRQIGVTK